MKSIVLTLATLLAVSAIAQPAHAFGGLFQRQRVVQHHRQAVVVRQQVVVQRVVAAPVYAQAIYAQPVVAVQQYHAAPVVQQVVAPACSQFFAH